MLDFYAGMGYIANPWIFDNESNWKNGAMSYWRNCMASAI